ncbi:MAG: chromosomal replication initiator protein DnaA [Oligoflexia bacterium]|nr:chromosomal replication initiator protein DnaA [Oligoflexia bacterium]
MTNQTELWQTTLQHLQGMTTPEMYKSWLIPLQIIEIKEKEVILGVPTPFFSTFIKGNFESKIIHALSIVTGQSFSIRYQVGFEKESDKINENNVLPNKIVPLHSFQESNLQNNAEYSGFMANRSHQDSLKEKSDELSEKNLIRCTSGNIDTSHTFSSFIVSSGTQFAHAAAKAAANFPGGKYNPLLIYGPSGLGKTHLLHAIAIEMLQNDPSARICYISAESFVNEFIDAVKNRSTGSFHSRYRNDFDAFLIDDIQYLGGKEKSEEEFFHTFNHLFGSKNQVVLTSDKPPKELHNLEDRLVSRLQQGLVVDVKPPDLETRVAILRAKAEAEDLFVPDDVCFMIAGHIRNNVRELEGALVRLSAEASINGTEITFEMAKEALADLLQEGKNNNLSIDSINKCVCSYFKISLNELNSKSRERKYAEPRQIAMYLSRKYTKKTLPEIAHAFGGKDHSTVIHAIKKIEKEIISSTTIKKYLDDIQQML